MCERDLSRLDQATTDGEEHAMLVREINMVRNLAKAYGTEAASASSAADKAGAPKRGGLFKMGGAEKEPKATQPKAQKKASPLPFRILGIVLALFVFLFVIVPIGNDANDRADAEKKAAPKEQVEAIQESEPPAPESAPEPEPEPAPEPESKPTAQVFENDFAKAEFKGIKDMDPYFFLNFMVTNRMGQNIVVTASDVVVNESVNVRANGGSSVLEPIEPGNSGYASLSVAYEYAGVGDVSAVKSVTGALVLNDESLHEVATLPFSVVI